MIARIGGKAHVSAVLTDPEYGLATLDSKDPKCGLFLSLEESGYSGDHDAPTTLLPNFGIDGIKRYSAGAKLLVYLHPQSASTPGKLELIKRLAAEASQKGVCFLVEPVLYALPGRTDWQAEMDSSWGQIYLEVCSQVAPHCDILKVQYPGSADACKSLSSLHPNWILLSRGVKFDTFVPYLETAARAGCVGYAAGRAVWQEIDTLNTIEAWEQFLATTSVSRLHQLTDILRSSKVSK